MPTLLYFLVTLLAGFGFHAYYGVSVAVAWCIGLIVVAFGHMLIFFLGFFSGYGPSNLFRDVMRYIRVHAIILSALSFCAYFFAQRYTWVSLSVLIVSTFAFVAIIRADNAWRSNHGSAYRTAILELDVRYVGPFKFWYAFYGEVPDDEQPLHWDGYLSNSDSGIAQFMGPFAELRARMFALNAGYHVY